MNQLRAKFILSILLFLFIPLSTNGFISGNDNASIHYERIETCIIFKAIEMDVAGKRFFPVSCWSFLAL